MFNDPVFFNNLFKKYIVYFGSLFKNIQIQRVDQNSNVIETLSVPIQYAPSNKMVARLKEFPTDFDNRDIAIILPRISFEAVSLMYDASRRIPTLNRVITDQAQSLYVPVPYNINFVLSIYIKNIEDGTRIVEQIIPYFGPEYTQKLNVMAPSFSSYDIITGINDITLRDTYEGNMTDPRYIIWTISFTMKVYFFRGIKSPGLIKDIKINLYDTFDSYIPYYNIQLLSGTFIPGDQLIQNNASALIMSANSTQIRTEQPTGVFQTGQRAYGKRTNAVCIINSITTANVQPSVLEIKPGLTANGMPTSNNSLSIPYEDINATDPFGLIVNIDEIEFE